MAKTLYSVHPSIPYVQNIIAKMKDKTGRSLDEWIALVKSKGPKTEPEQREWLKETHRLGTNYAWWIAERAAGRGDENSDARAYLRKAPLYVDEMFAGKRGALKPVYDRLLITALQIGKDVKACPCKTIVPLYREHVFAEIKPATHTRIDLGLALGDWTRPMPTRIEPVTHAKGNRITHRIAIASLGDVDTFVGRWLKNAYDADAAH